MVQLAPYDREAYLMFHRLAYREDLELSRTLLARSPRWSIITGYYAMHNLAKLYLGAEHGIRITGEHIHESVVRELDKALRHTSERKRLLDLLATADAAFKGLQQPREVAELLERGRRNRSAANYYLREGSTAIVQMDQAKQFQDGVVKVFVAIMERMTDAA